MYGFGSIDSLRDCLSVDGDVHSQNDLVASHKLGRGQNWLGPRVKRDLERRSTRQGREVSVECWTQTDR